MHYTREEKKKNETRKASNKTKESVVIPDKTRRRELLSSFKSFHRTKQIELKKKEKE